MRPVLCVLPVLAALAATPVFAQPHAQPKPPTRAERIDACVKDIQNSGKTGQKNTMTPMQRRTAEEQCRARAEAEDFSGGEKR